MEGYSVMLQVSTLQSEPWGARLGTRQYGFSVMGRTKGSWSCPEAPETQETPTTPASTFQI